jgi:sugar phosphate isomerase/epimerase
MKSPPILGAAMPLDAVDAHRDWLLGHPRDLELQDFVSAEILEGDWSGLVDRAKRLLDGHAGRLGIHGPFWGLPVSSPDPDVQAVVRKRLEQALDVAEALKADQIVIHSPYTTWMHNNLDAQAGQREKVIADAHRTIAQAVRRAEDQGCVFVLENIEDKNPSDRRILVESFGSPSLKLSVDTGHAAYANGSTGAPPVDFFIRDAGDQLRHIHLQDADGFADRHWPLGHGTLNWHAIFAALGEIRSNPRLIIEIRDKSKIRESAAFLERLGLAM